MTDEQIKLYAIARVVLPTDVRVRALRDDAPALVGGSIYTVETTDSKGVRRWLAVSARVLKGDFPEHVIGREIRRAYDNPA